MSTKCSRRTAVATLLSAPGAIGAAVAAEQPSNTLAETSPDDTELIELGKRLTAVREGLDSAGGEYVFDLLLQADDIERKIGSLRATTLAGLQVKARATAWALMHECGLFNAASPAKEQTANDRMAASLVFDLLEIKVSTSV